VKPNHSHSAYYSILHWPPQPYINKPKVGVFAVSKDYQYQHLYAGELEDNEWTYDAKGSETAHGKCGGGQSMWLLYNLF
jgi:hypothetical protein